MTHINNLALLAVLTVSALFGQEKKAPEPVLVHIGDLTLKPSAFVDAIGMTRSEETPDSVATKLGKVPLTDTPAESIGSARHSRLMLRGDLPVGIVKISAYMESDFMNFTQGQSAYRWRHYWGQAKIGKWEFLGGKTFCLLLPNRAGISVEKDVFSTDVVDPSYHVGLLAARTRQVRVSRSLGAHYKAAVAWEGDGNVLTKVARDVTGLHLEAVGLAGRFGRKGVAAATSLSVAPKVRIVTQQYWSNRAAYQALGVVPTGINGYSTLDGVEVQARKTLEVFSYGGVVYASRSKDNRVVRQWTVGINQKLNAPTLFGSVLMSLEYSHLDREMWTGKAGSMDFVMYRMRYTFN